MATAGKNRGARGVRKAILFSACFAIFAVFSVSAQTRHRRVALLRRRPAQPSLLAAGAGDRRQFQHARSRLALQDRQPGPAPRIQARRHAAGRQRRALYHGRDATRGGGARRGNRRAALGALGARRGPRGGITPSTVGAWCGVLDRREGRTDPVRHHRLPPRGARCQDRRAHPLVRQGRHRRSEGRGRVRQGAADRSRGGRNRTARDAGRHQGRRGDDRRGDARRRHAKDAQQHQGSGARLRRAHRQEALDVQHDSASRRVRQRHVGKRIVGGERQRRRLESDWRGRGTRARVSAGRDAEL